MKRKSLLFLSVAMFASLPFAAEAAGSRFKRDRSVPVASRVPAGYAGHGLRYRSFNIVPKVDFGFERNNNIYYIDTSKVADTILSMSPSVAVSSDWGRHALSASLATTYESYEKNTTENATAYNFGLAGRLDLHGDSNIFGGLAISQNHEGRYNPSSTRQAAKPIKFNSETGNVGFKAVGNRLMFTGRADYRKINYFDAPKIGGGIIDQDVRDYTRTSLTGRADYALSPDTSIYVTYVGNKRDYRTSSQRDSIGYDAAIGTSFELTNLVRGEIQLGYLSQDYKNPLFKTSKGGSFKAKVEYFPTELTTVTFDGGRSVEETPDVNASGYVSSDFNLRVDHELLRNLVVTAGVSRTSDDYEGTNRKDARGAFDVGARYLVSSTVSVRAGYTYSDLSSKGSNGISPYKDSTFKISLGLQY